MSIRRVRFAVDDSPLSTSSTLSSPGPVTPPQLYQPLVDVRQPSPPYPHSPAYSPNTHAFAIAPELHRALAAPSFDFDVSIDPANNPIMRNNHQLERILNEPAVGTRITSLTIISRHLPWEIVISSSTYPFVTISDVLGGLHRALRLPVRQEEFQRESTEEQGAISAAYYRRCERLPEGRARELESFKGVKRVDFLAGATRFMGLSKTDRPNVWSIKFKGS
ncbi:hypothetical protein NP233_g1743 [Leucocoprinus birnbaumii]|uniref:DUF6699 domain-containing protein n=1 Tax=Leucocoprinus birnbaumii TaxID=56174 RepID=A0AAD5W013_9AGAR|nr:hypothetical protein NP233_g1743 [Leucocoprinus birnbaumii]